jgi:hypothetical protein
MVAAEDDRVFARMLRSKDAARGLLNLPRSASHCPRRARTPIVAQPLAQRINGLSPHEGTGCLETLSRQALERTMPGSIFK